MSYSFWLLASQQVNVNHQRSPFEKLRLERIATQPLMVIANTIKGKGIPEIEGDYRYHAIPLTPEQQEKASRVFQLRIEEIDRELAEDSLNGVPVKAVADRSGPETGALAADLNEIIAKNPAGEYREPTATRIGYGNAFRGWAYVRTSLF